MKTLTRTMTFDSRFLHLYRPLVKKLAVVFVVTLLAAQAALVYFDERLVDKMSSTIIDGAGRATASQLGRLFDMSRNALMVAQGEIADVDLEDEGDDAWMARLRPVLETYAFLDSVNVADTAGNEFVLIRGDDALMTRRMRAAEPGVADWRRWRDGVMLEEWRRETEVSPTQRPWFVGAMGHEPGARYWTEPYEFLTTSQPGISISTRSETAAGSRVMAFNVELGEISRFTMTHRPSENGVSLAFDKNGRVLGLPADERFSDDRAVLAASLLPVDQLAVPSVDAAVAAWEQQGRPSGILPFRGPGGARWWAGFSEVPLDADHAAWSAVLVPRADLLGNVVTTRNLALGGIALAGLLVGAGFFLTAMRSIRRQMKEAVDRVSQKLGQYHIEARVGEGGNGTVYRARHSLLRRPTALKLMNPAFASSESARKRFEHEVRLTSTLSHPNTVAIYDFGRTSEGTLYYAMELLEGATLERLVAATGPLPEGRVIHLVSQVCGSLAEAHGKGLIHRDIKPSNIIACERGGVVDVVKVLDFGLVKELTAADGNLTQAEMLVGTPFFMAPETISRPGAAGVASDLYALGAVAYFLLTGRHVFEGESAVQVCASHLHDPPEPPSRKIGRPVDPDLEAIVLRCLAKDPADRPRSADDLRVALEGCEAAGRWTQADARAWWGEHAPGLVGQAGATEPSRLSQTELLVDMDSRLATRSRAPESGG